MYGRAYFRIEVCFQKACLMIDRKRCEFRSSYSYFYGSTLKKGEFHLWKAKIGQTKDISTRGKITLLGDRG